MLRRGLLPVMVMLLQVWLCGGVVMRRGRGRRGRDAAGSSSSVVVVLVRL